MSKNVSGSKSAWGAASQGSLSKVKEDTGKGQYKVTSTGTKVFTSSRFIPPIPYNPSRTVYKVDFLLSFRYLLLFYFILLSLFYTLKTIYLTLYIYSSKCVLLPSDLPSSLPTKGYEHEQESEDKKEGDDEGGDEDIKLHTSLNRWTMTEATGDDAILRIAQSILNKLTIEKFDKLVVSCF